ncbi:MAG: SH3 domain-containing protein [Chloroflexota bacterium]
MKTTFAVLVGLVFTVALLSIAPGARAEFAAQIPTVAIPTVTGTPVGAIATVLDSEQGFINVRSGPSSVYYDIVGMLTEGAQVPALGRSPGGEWIQIAYPGVPGGVAWIWKDLVSVQGSLPVVDTPPTPTPRVTATIDPTLAAQFLVDVPPTRMPTFTEPAPISMPTFSANDPITSSGRVPMGLVIVGMAVIGLFGTLISFLRGR